MRVFVSGKISGLPYNEVCAEFYKAAKVLLDRGDIPILPIEICRSCWSWWRCMAVCLLYLVGCDAIFQLPTWHESRGARIEYKFAKILRKRIVGYDTGIEYGRL